MGERPNYNIPDGPRPSTNEQQTSHLRTQPQDIELGGVIPNRRQRRAVRKERKTKKAAIQVGTLNMRGYGNPRLMHADNKWKHIWCLMKNTRLGVLALQETHLTNERVDEITDHYGKRIQIFASHDLTNPTGKGGVAIIVNRGLISVEHPKMYQIIPGRAILLQITIHKEDRLNILAVYAPNVTGSNGSENAQFWKEIQTYFETRPHVPKPNIMLGDCNMVEAGVLDRLPAHDDPEEASEALDNLKIMLKLRDGWRSTNPNDRAFTYMQSATGSQSRIDRIYVTDSVLETAREWKIRESGVPNADHNLVSVQVTSEEAPWIGRGRWRVPDYVVKDKDFLSYAREQGIKAEQELKSLTTRTQINNAQTIWHALKSKIISKAKARAKQIVPGLIRKINETQLELDRTLNDIELSEELRIEQAQKLKTKVADLEQTRMQKMQIDSRTRYRLERELPSRYMSQVN
ncbi:Endonuclease/exonuclease/phosphatase, partial [Lentinula edodes]